MTRLASKPAFCAACYQADPLRYVDFEAAYDGPVIPGSPAHIAIDDLVICENCLNTAFNLLDPQGKDETIAELLRIVKDQQAEIAAKDKMLTGATATIEELVDHPITKPPGKPALIGLSPEDRKKITQARYERNGSSAAPKKKVAA